MDNNIKDTLTPEECTSRIFELSGAKFEPEIAADLWPDTAVAAIEQANVLREAARLPARRASGSRSTQTVPL